MRSKGWGFRKVEAAFSYFLFLVSYSLFPCVLAPLRLCSLASFARNQKRSKGSIRSMRSKGWEF